MAHDLTLDWMKKTQSRPLLRRAYSQRLIDDPVEVAGLRFPNRVGLAAGLDKNGRCIDGMASIGFGFIEIGTVTPLAQKGNSKPRMFRVREAAALINRMGFNNQGLEAVLNNVQKSHVRKTPETGPRLGINIGKNASTPIERASDDYVTCLQQVYPYADYIAVNISSPNTKHLRDLQASTPLNSLLERLCETRESLRREYPQNKPIFLKISPDLSAEQIGAIAEVLKKHCIEGVIATNTTLSHEEVGKYRDGDEIGGVSGAPLRQISTEVIRRLRALMGPDFPIMGVGGIQDAEDAVEKIEAGADLVQVYSGMIFQGPALVPAVAHAIKTHFAKKALLAGIENSTRAP